MNFNIQSYSQYNKKQSINYIFLTKIKNISTDVISLIDDYLSGFAFYKLTLEKNPSKYLQLDLTMKLRKNMKKYPQRIGQCMIMLLMNDELFYIPLFNNIKKNTYIPISDEIYILCCKFAMIEYINKIKNNNNNYKLYVDILSNYFTYITHTKVHISIIDI